MRADGILIPDLHKALFVGNLSIQIFKTMQDKSEEIISKAEFIEIEATPVQRFMTGLLDFAIDIAFIFLLYITGVRNLISVSQLRPAHILVIVILLATIYRYLFLLLFNKTLGMMLFRVKFLNKKLEPLSKVEKLYSIFRTRFSQIKLYKDR